MLQKFKKHIDENFSFLKEKKILIAVSGGVDSVVLTHLFSKLNFNISLAHCNFNLREKESDLDEEFVKNLSQNIYSQVFIVSFNTHAFAKKNKQSTQIAARNLRYNWFEKLSKEHHLDYILTAHHADDNLETFLINLTRGSGLDGFTGIPEVNENIVRPLLIFSREEIINYAKKNKIEWREDISNTSTKYIRNKIRHQIVPVLKEINPSMLESFSKTIRSLQESREIIKDSIEKVSLDVISSENNVTKIDIEKVKKLSNPKAYLYQFLKPYNFTEWNDIYNLLSAQSGKNIFSKTHSLLKDRNYLLLITKEEKRTNKLYFIEESELKITTPIYLTFEKTEEVISENNCIYVSEKLLTFPLIVRKWQNGDYFYPSGMKGKKKLSKYFKDEKLSLLEKEQIWLLCNNQNNIIWVIGKRQDNRYFDTTNNPPYLKITFQ